MFAVAAGVDVVESETTEGSLLVSVTKTASVAGADSATGSTASSPGFKVMGESRIDGPVLICTIVASVAVLLAEPPPETVTPFVTLAGAFPATFTVTVMGG